MSSGKRSLKNLGPGYLNPIGLSRNKYCWAIIQMAEGNIAMFLTGSTSCPIRGVRTGTGFFPRCNAGETWPAP